MGLLLSIGSKAQVVLNEIYADPSAGNHEFFELYNTSYFGSPTSLDGYTLMSYFENGREKGFYVMDLPNISISPKSFSVGSSSLPFNFQGNTGSTASDFNWNDPSLVSNYGYIRKWVATGNTAADGNRNYDEYPLPNTFNDFFSRLSGGGASYNAFLYKNGVLVNSFVGGTGGSTSIPTRVANMPAFRLETVMATGGKTYNITWNSGRNKKPEYVIQDIGTDNGFIRKRDGMCGTWDKSSSTAFHTPKVTNGGSQMEIVGLLTIAAHIYPGTNESDPPFVVYDITAGPTDLFPVELHVYTDNGSVPNELDANDSFVEANTESKLSDGSFTTYFPENQNILIVAQTDAGCWDQIKFVLNSIPYRSPLALQLKMFTGKNQNGKSLLEWVVSSNETGSYFEVEKSRDGKVFTSAGLVFTTASKDEAYYTYGETLNGDTYYKLKMVHTDKSVSYSPVVLVKDGVTNGSARLQLLKNPVSSSLLFTYQSAQTEVGTVNIYNTAGVKLYSSLRTVQKGTNTFLINLDKNFANGVYLLELVSNSGQRIERFIKN